MKMNHRCHQKSQEGTSSNLRPYPSAPCLEMSSRSYSQTTIKSSLPNIGFNLSFSTNTLPPPAFGFNLPVRDPPFHPNFFGGECSYGFQQLSQTSVNNPPEESCNVEKRSPTLVATQRFNAKKDADCLRMAMKGVMCHETSILMILTKRSSAQRREIAANYKTLYGKNVLQTFKSKLSGSFQHLIVALMTPLPQFYAKELYEATAGLGTDEDVLIETLCTLNNNDIITVRQIYEKIYQKTLESDLKEDTSGHFRKLLISLCNAARDETMITDRFAAKTDARELLQAGELRLGTNESIFNKILCQRNYAQLRLIFNEYKQMSGHDIEKAIKKGFSGDIQDGLLSIVRCTKDKTDFFARRLHKNIQGIEKDDRNVIRLIVTRCEIDMGDIKKAYSARYKKSLARAIKDECHGSYRKGLLALIGES